MVELIRNPTQLLSFLARWFGAQGTPFFLIRTARADAEGSQRRHWRLTAICYNRFLARAPATAVQRLGRGPWR
jgi:hypothetical protein